MSQPATATPLLKPKPWLALAGLGFCLALALLLRWPMMTAAERHLDSDLAVDGLTLRQFVQEGRWRWHYPGTPHIGTAPLLLSLPAVAVWGEGPAALVFAGVAANLLLIAGVYGLTCKAYGPTPAFFAGLMLAAGGLGQMWLSGRVTGGHLLAAAWLAWAWLGWSRLIGSAKCWPWLVFGIFCGLGLWVDSLFLLALPGLGVASLMEAWAGRNEIPIKTRVIQAVCFIAMLPIGPGLLKLGDGVNVYGAQFESVTDQELIFEHAIILFLECMPRLVFGQNFYSSGPMIQMPPEIPASGNRLIQSNIALLLYSSMILLLLGGAMAGRKAHRRELRKSKSGHWVRSMWAGFYVMALLNILSFLFNKNIFNSDNYRYLVLLLVPLGIFYGRTIRPGPWGILSRILILGMALLFSIEIFDWQSRYGLRNLANYNLMSEKSRWLVTDHLIRSPLSTILNEENGASRILKSDVFETDYWDVYKALYLCRMSVTAARPFGIYPNRFRDEAPTRVRYIVFSSLSRTPPQMFQIVRSEGAKLIREDQHMEIYERRIGDLPGQIQPATPPPVTGKPENRSRKE